MSRMIDLFERTALLALEKQDKFGRVVSEHLVDLDLVSGTARFGTDIELPFKVLGTTSDNTLTWLWAWSEAQDQIPENVAVAARELRAWGEREGLPEFIEPEVDLGRGDGQMLSMVAVEAAQASCFYRDPYEGGALYFLISGKEIDAQPSLDAERLAFHLRELSEEYEINPRNALLAYFTAKELSSREEGTAVLCRLGNGEPFKMEFDDQGRLVREA